MAKAFTVTAPILTLADKPRRVLVTGAGGTIGSSFAQRAHEKYDLRLMVQRPEDAAGIGGYGDVVVGDLTDAPRMHEFCEGIDTILHLAADAHSRAPWESVLPNNIVGTYNLFQAAASSGCRRVVFASSIHAVLGYPRDVQIRSDDPVNPIDLYGVSKCFGEALGRYYAEQQGLSTIAIRIGGFLPVDLVHSEVGPRLLDFWVSARDLQQLIERCIEVEGLQFAVFHGVSNNRFKRLDISDARNLVGYGPEDDVADENSTLSALHLGEPE